MKKVTSSLGADVPRHYLVQGHINNSVHILIILKLDPYHQLTFYLEFDFPFFSSLCYLHIFLRLCKYYLIFTTSLFLLLQ